MAFDRKKYTIPPWVESGHFLASLLFLAVASLFLVMLYPTLMANKISYEIGDVAETDIKAPKDFLIEDGEATEARRRQAVAAVLTVYDHDLSLALNIVTSVQEAFAMCRAALAAEPEVLWIDPTGRGETDLSEVNPEFSSSAEALARLKDGFEEKMGIGVSDGAFRILEQERFSEQIENFIVRLITEILNNGVVVNKEMLLRESEKGITLRNINNGAERAVLGLKALYGLDQAKTMVRIVGEPLLKELNYNLRNLVVDFVQQLIQPNITLNRSESESRKRDAVAAINPVLYRIKAGEMLLREGERVTEIQRLKLEALNRQVRQERRLASGLGASVILFTLLTITHLLFLNPRSDFRRNHRKNLLFVVSVVVLFLFLARLALPLAFSLTRNTGFSLTADSLYLGIPLASAVMILCLFMGLEIALPFAVVMAVGAALILKNRLDLLLYFLISGSMAAYWVRNCRERIVFIKAGLKIGLLNAFLAMAIDLYAADYAGLKMVWDWTFAFLGGVVSGILTAGIAPLVESAFDYTTDIKLLELANLDRPILRRLMLEAPGTYHHSVVVGSLVEAAASEIGANPLLAKVCGYYHDIGKINKPLYFIENQMGGKNRHDKLAPSMSKRILVAHVKDGVEIAKKNRLGQVIADTIQQSHGTSLIAYFYEKARQQLGDDAVKADDFRYPGPKPQTREAGLVMLADMVEAASRTLENPIASRIQGLVQNLTNKTFSDGQLDECELTLKDLHKIAKSYIKILTGIHHHRIEYPDKAAATNGKDKNERTDRQPPRGRGDLPGERAEDGASHLKRLGIS